MARYGRHRAPGRHVRPKAFKSNAIVAYAAVALVLTGSSVVSLSRPIMAAVHPDQAKALTLESQEPNIRYIGAITTNVTEIESIEPEKDITLNADIAKGTEFIMNPGKAGKANVTYLITTIDGQVIKKTEISREVIAEPKNASVIQGTGDPNNIAVALETASQGVGNPAGNKDYAEIFIQQEYGWGDKEFKCLSTLWKRESNWRHQARNRSSGAYGIAQALPGSKMSSVGSDWRTNPVTQIKWGAQYIEKRYDTPCKALDHSYSRGWY
jgi:hypothetical protein